MRLVVIGLGSMGKRRIRLIKETIPDVFIYGIDARSDRRKEAEETFQIRCLESMEKVPDKESISGALVCTSPLSHATIINECLKNKWNVFTELNLVSDGYMENVELAKKQGCVLFLSSTFLYREEIRYIQKQVKENEKWNYMYHVGQYLPDWHTWESYKEFFVGDARTNGCREIMAIELPWLTETFGKILDCRVISDKMSGLEINYKDNYLIQLVHENSNKGLLAVDVVSPVAVRRLEVYGENRYLRWGGTPDSLMEYDDSTEELRTVKLTEKEEHLDGYRRFVVENAYKTELQEFFDILAGKKQQGYGFLQDFETLKLIDQLER